MLYKEIRFHMEFHITYQELATRINHAKPKVVLAGSCGIEPSGVIPYQPLVNSAIDIAVHKPQKVWRTLLGQGYRAAVNDVRL